MVTLLPILLLPSLVAVNSPRLKLDFSGEAGNRTVFERAEEFATTLRVGKTVYVGGNGVLYQINFDKSPTPVMIKVPGDSKECSGDKSGTCGNYIMIFHKFNEANFILCGTNWMTPKCWLLFNNELKEFLNERNFTVGPGICPEIAQRGFASLVVEERIYSSASDGHKEVLTVYKKGDKPLRLKSHDEWIKDPKFVGMSPLGNLVYVFFRERIAQENPDVDPWISRIGRVCKNDRGGSRQRLLSKWATFLKARLLCSNPAENVHFNRIEDAFIYESPYDGEQRVYGVFSSNWNGTAVCVYSTKEISDVFGQSGFKGYGGSIPSNPRPGQCVTNTKELPDQVLTVVENNPEMNSWIYPIGKKPLIINHQNRFKKIVVDSVVDPDGNESRILYVAMGDGKVQKILETGHSAFIITELTLLKEPALILSMSLDSVRKFLYVTSAKELLRFPLVQCEEYCRSCEGCVQARDPYCGWNHWKKKCVHVTPNSKNILQDLKRGDSCPPTKAVSSCSSWQTTHPGWLALTFPLKKRVPVYLSCPKHSYHADYYWSFKDGSKELPCSSSDNNCLLSISELSKSDVGSYTCISNERGVKHHHAAFVIKNTGDSSIYLSSAALYSMTVVVIWQYF
ncbi:semaphorin-7A-like isoform X1 [Hemitrygon akajei]|uniref:semaphorin-7A-like isoform X1 n=3 Tax=Hemitrygon akajei TaxID=2704970 RepID=UPI003BF98E9E